MAEVRSIEVSRIGSAKGEILPPTLEAMMEEYGSIAREAGFPDFGVRSVAIRRSLRTWEDDGQMLGGQTTSGTLCVGGGLETSNGTVTYRHESRPAYSPENFEDRYGHYPRVAKTEAGGTVVIHRNVGEQRGGAGRAGGPWGWSEDGDLIAGALASFAHNFIATLLGYFDRPRLPCTDEWKIPNLVLAETRAPDQFHPDASYRFSGIAPTPVHAYTFRVDTPTDAVIGLEWWDSDKSRVARRDKVELEKGANRVVSSITGIPSPPVTGFFNVNVLDAPRGVTVSKVRTSPPASPLGR